jgi:hypothetical protein
MHKHPAKSGDNVLQMAAKAFEARNPARDFAANAAAAAPAALADAGSPDDPRMREAMRLVEAFLAIEDTAARTALIALAERLVTHDWLRRVQQR